jgi:predicted dehydrogenase
VSVVVGVLGAANIVHMGLVEPAAAVDGIEVGVIAARDRDRAAAYAAEHGIPRVVPSYDDVINDPGVDAVYVPTPSALHGYWVRRAIEAGKHVLCEKPFTANADEAAEIADLAANGIPVVMEAFHSHYHPLWTRMAEIIGSGALGEVREARASFCVPITDTSDIRWQLALGGGALMDMGVYPLRLLRHLFGEPEVRAAQARDIGGIDASMTAELAFAGSVSGQVVASMWAEDPFASELHVTGSAGRMHVHMPYHPHMQGLITITTPDGEHTEPGETTSTYSLMLEAFRNAVRDGAPVPTDARQATAVMRAIDAIYLAAGMQPRRPFPVPAS